jgi:hypothetical protein
MPPGISTVLPRQVQYSGDTPQSQRTNLATNSRVPRTTDRFDSTQATARSGANGLKVDRTPPQQLSSNTVGQSFVVVDQTRGIVAGPSSVNDVLEVLFNLSSGGNAQNAVKDIRSLMTFIDSKAPIGYGLGTIVNGEIVDQGVPMYGTGGGSLQKWFSKIGASKVNPYAIWAQAIKDALSVVARNPNEATESVRLNNTIGGQSSATVRSTVQEFVQRNSELVAALQSLQGTLENKGKEQESLKDAAEPPDFKSTVGGGKTE